MKQKPFLQIFLCLFTLIVCASLVFRSKTRLSQAGAFGNTNVFNETFEDFACALYGDLFYE